MIPWRCPLLLWQLFSIAASAKKPNFLFILTDDQDWHMESLAHMPYLQKHMIHEGTLYSNHFCTVAICCPARATLWTGRAAHNTNVTDIFPPYGGFPKVVDEGINDDYLPIWLQESGYNTYYTGKLWNAHNVDNYMAPYVNGFNSSDFILDPNTYNYLHAVMTRDGRVPVSYKGQYSPDVTAEKAYGYLDEAMSHDEPWFVGIAPIAPHSHVETFNASDSTYANTEPKYAERHAHLFKDYKIPRDANFNPKTPSGVSWIRKLEQLNDTVIGYNDEFQRARLRALQSVDEMVEKLVKKLEAKGELDNTYIIYTTDNGYHISQHRLNPGKECGFDTDIHIPLIIRGPGIAKGHKSEAVTAHTDLAPTIMNLAGATRESFDGKPINVHDDIAAVEERHEHVNIEFWGMGIPEGIYGKYGDLNYEGENTPRRLTGNNTYKGLRLIGDEYSLYYSVWCTGEREFYDMIRDPFQVNNVLGVSPALSDPKYELYGRKFSHVWARLDALMMVLKSCKQDSCREPWKALHPDGSVRHLRDALAPHFDEFYAQQPRVQFTSCELGYLVSVEGPQKAHQYGEDGEGARNAELRKRSPSSFHYGGELQWWT